MPNVTTGAGPALGGGWEGSEASGLLWSCLGSLASVLLEIGVEPQLEVEHGEAGSKDRGRRWGKEDMLQARDTALARLDFVSLFPSLGSEVSWLRLQGSRPWKLSFSEACWVLLLELLELGARIPSPAARRRC